MMSAARSAQLDIGRKDGGMIVARECWVTRYYNAESVLLLHLGRHTDPLLMICIIPPVKYWYGDNFFCKIKSFEDLNN